MDYTFFFFFKQKTAYELRISDWSSDVCSADLLSDAEQNLRDDLRGWLDSDYTFAAHLARTATAASRDDARWRTMVDRGWIARALPCRDAIEQSTIDAAIIAEEFGRAVVVEPFFRSEERRGGPEVVRTC